MSAYPVLENITLTATMRCGYDCFFSPRSDMESGYGLTNALFENAHIVDTFRVKEDHLARLIENRELLDSLRNTRFDVALHELYDLTAVGVLELIGVKKTIVVSAAGMTLHMKEITGVPPNPSFVPGLFTTYSDEMTFWERLDNFKLDIELNYRFLQWEKDLWKMFEDVSPGFPDLRELLKRKTGVILINSNEFTETPRPRGNIVRYIGGLAIPKPKPLDQVNLLLVYLTPLRLSLGNKKNSYMIYKCVIQKLSAILDKRHANVLFSMGSFAKSSTMPLRLKKGSSSTHKEYFPIGWILDILDAFAVFPNTTFIFKYDGKDDLELFKPYPNVHVMEWVPQVDLLSEQGDKRLSLFITHAGLNSITEATYFGKPTITIPLFGDQFINAKNLRRIGLAVLIERNKLNKDTLIAAIREELSAILDKRSTSVLFSMGSLAKSSTMPLRLKKDILNAFAAFPNTTFIFKYDGKDDLELFEPYPNVHVMKWVPQVDLLGDKRLSLFVTHAGLNSITEATYFGKPMITIPLFADQFINAKNLRRIGLAVLIERNNLNKDTLIAALREVLSPNAKYTHKASTVARYLRGLPTAARAEVTRWVELVAEEGQMEHLMMKARDLSFIQYYCLDIIGYFLAQIVVALCVVFLELNTLLDKRNSNVLFSFGTFTQAKNMPLWLKKGIVEAFASFPNTTFIWKYEDESETELFGAHPNIRRMKWVPQNDLLADERLSLFITHAGMNSIIEATFAGKPMVAIPLFGDQFLNAKNLRRRGLAIVIERNKLTKDTLIAAIREALSPGSSYARKAAVVAQQLHGRAAAAREELSRWVKLVAEEGQMDHLLLRARDLSFIQYHCLDIIAFLLAQFRLDAILNERSTNVFLSFGTISQSKDLPLILKKDIISAFSTFPNTTFIWKYEDDSDIHLFKNHTNIHTMKWIPQSDLLGDKRLSAFITHAGMNSILEATFSGKPMVVVPLFGDQYLNAKNMERRGTAVMIDKRDLNKDTLTAAIRKVLSPNATYARKAATVARSLEGRVAAARADLLYWVKLVAEEGQMDHLMMRARDLSFTFHQGRLENEDKALENEVKGKISFSGVGQNISRRQRLFVNRHECFSPQDFLYVHVFNIYMVIADMRSLFYGNPSHNEKLRKVTSLNNNPGIELSEKLTQETELLAAILPD
ncbi:unnamed protein product [Haemonchus placei]|uniref:glucuronosyltransferase n=1 Tax=Haemonchus placei TaxID=6290 RepID=A0A158QKE3_HAEPC|nr:unnamed protein product [Haemonchus placei]